MGLWDAIFDNIISPVAETVGDGLCAVGRGIDTAVNVVVIDGIGGGIDSVIDSAGSAINFAGEAVVDGIGSVGRGIDTAVNVVVIDGIGGGIDSVIDSAGSVIDFVKENPVESLVIAATIVDVTGGAKSTFSGVTAGMDLGTTSKMIRTSAEITAKEAALYIAVGFVAKEVIVHTVDNYIRENVSPVKGSIVYCDLAAVMEHSGVYIGDGKMVHLDGTGNIEVVTREEFLNRLGGFNTAMSIYVSCSDNNAIGNTSVAERAIAMTSNRRNYNIILDNCHQFTSGCITGNFENSDNFGWMLKHTTKQHYAANSWRVWG